MMDYIWLLTAIVAMSGVLNAAEEFEAVIMSASDTMYKRCTLPCNPWRSCGPSGFKGSCVNFFGICGTSKMDNACLCVQCGRNFKTIRTLTQHQKIHSGVRPHVCEVCNKSFVRKDVLQEHVKTHGPSKANYVCQECGKAFSRRFSLQAHEMHHTPENRFACSMCDKTYLTKSNLERHKETHNPKEKCPKCNVEVVHLKLHLKTCGTTASYPCTTCGEKFGQKRYLVQHQLSHLPTKTFECTKCHKTFKHRGSLHYHNKRCVST